MYIEKVAWVLDTHFLRETMKLEWGAGYLLTLTLSFPFYSLYQGSAIDYVEGLILGHDSKEQIMKLNNDEYDKII